jgi:hypothetical protein
MKSLVSIILFILIINARAISQDFSIGFQSGIATYSMLDLKKINKIIPGELPFDTKTVANFPPFFYFSAVVKKRIGNVNLGLVYLFQSTGSRISGKDYSGEYRFDMLVNCSAPGIYSEVILPSSGKSQFSYFSIAGFAYSGLKLNEFLNVLDENVTDETYRFRAVNYYIEPGFSYNYPYRFFNFGINAGYLIQFRNNAFHSTGNKNEILTNPQSGEPAVPGWSGLRAGLSFTICFPSKEK